MTLFVLLVGGDVGLRHWSWNELVARTAHINSLEVWQPYMETTYCEFLDAAASETDDELYVWTFDANREAATLAARLEQRVRRLEGLFIGPWHEDLAAAKSTIMDHYDVWSELLRREQEYLSIASFDDDIYNGYLDVVFSYDDAISATFHAARDSYYMAEPPWVDNPQAIEDAFLDSDDFQLTCDTSGTST